LGALVVFDVEPLKFPTWGAAPEASAVSEDDGPSLICSNDESSGSLVATGIAAMFAFYAFINMGMVMGITPATGLPLPLISYGGSSMVSSLGCSYRLVSGYMRMGMLATASRVPSSPGDSGFQTQSIGRVSSPSSNCWILKRRDRGKAFTAVRKASTATFSFGVRRAVLHSRSCLVTSAPSLVVVTIGLRLWVSTFRHESTQTTRFPR